MAGGESIMDLCRARVLRQREEARQNARDVSDAIRRTTDPLVGEDAERPFMIPMGHDPYDIWHNILDKIIDPDETLKLWEVCPMFREILSTKQKYIQARLPQIVQLILDKHPEYLLENQIPLDDDDFPVPAGNIIGLNKTVLNLRILSKHCRSAVEQVLQHMTDPKWKKFFLILRTRDQVQEIIDAILGKEIMPDSFFPPNVEVWEVDDHEAFYDAVGVLLELIGKRVKTFGFKSLKSSQDLYEKLSDWVLYMPNLENLELSPIGFRNRIQNGQVAVVPTYAEIPAFPNCPKLRSFIQFWKILPNAYLRHILETNPLIKVLSLPKYGPVEEFPNPSELPNLECLRIPLYTSLLNSLEFQPPLKEIVLHGSFNTSQRFTSKEVFTFLHRFKDTLEQVELQFIEIAMTGKCFLELPHLKVFKGWCNGFFKGLHFLLHSERVEAIEMQVWQKDASLESFSDGFFMKITNGFDGLSVWDVFPRLQMFQLEFPVSMKPTTVIRSSGKIEVFS